MADIRWVDPTLPLPWEAVYLEPEGWVVLAPLSQVERLHRPHVAGCGRYGEPEARDIVAWRKELGGGRAKMEEHVREARPEARIAVPGADAAEAAAGGMRACVERAVACLEGTEDGAPGGNGYAALLNMRDALSADAGLAAAACVHAVRARQAAAKKGARGDLGRDSFSWCQAPPHVTHDAWVSAGDADDAAHAAAVSALAALDETSR